MILATMKKQTAEDVENIPVWPINVLVLLISVERNNVYSVRNHGLFYFVIITISLFHCVGFPYL